MKHFKMYGERCHFVFLDCADGLEGRKASGFWLPEVSFFKVQYVLKLYWGHTLYLWKISIAAVFCDEHWCFREIASRSWVSRAAHPPPVCERVYVRKCVVFHHLNCLPFVGRFQALKGVLNTYERKKGFPQGRRFLIRRMCSCGVQRETVFTLNSDYQGKYIA